MVVVVVVVVDEGGGGDCCGEVGQWPIVRSLSAKSNAVVADDDDCGADHLL